MLALAIDTCLNACTVVVTRDGVVLAATSEPMVRGHQERLAPMVRETVAAAGVGFADFGRIAATVGPGSFTGLRVGLAFAKGAAAALSVPCAGIETLEALAQNIRGRVIAIVDARRGQAYWQAYEGARALNPPTVGPASEAAAFAREWAIAAATGPGAGLLDLAAIPPDAPLPDALAQLAVRDPVRPPAPLYLRAPDAKLPGGVSP